MDETPLTDEMREELRKPRRGKTLIDIGWITRERREQADTLTGLVNNVVPVHSYCAGQRGLIEEGYVVALEDGQILQGVATSNSQFEIAERIAALRYAQDKKYEMVFYLTEGQIIGFSQRLPPPPGLQEREKARGWTDRNKP